MRLLKTIPHSQFRISIFLWNEKYLIKMETPTFEQVYKIPESFGDLEKITALLSEKFNSGAVQVFQEMKKNLEAELRV